MADAALRMELTEPTPRWTGPRLSMSMFGPMALSFSGRPVRLIGRKARAVLGCLVLNPTSRETRERLVGLLWSDSDEDRARTTLRQTLREIRQAFSEAGFGGLQANRLTIELDPASVEVDLASVIEEAEAHRAHPLLLGQARLADTLLLDLDDIDAEFRVYLLAKRHSLQQRLIRALETGMRRDDLDRPTRSRLAEATINLDPTHEEACRLLMQWRAEAGDIGGALKLYKQLWDLLDDEYGMEPSAPTQQLVADVKSGAFEPAAVPIAANLSAAPAVRSGSKLVLSVGVVDVRGLAADKPHLIEGFRQHLIACLVRFREWYVTDQPLQLIAANEPSDVSASYEINILAQETGDSIGLVLILKEVDSNIYVWSETFELKLENWFELQRRIVTRIATALKVHLSTERIMRFSAEPDVALGIYDRWLRCQSQILTFSPEDWHRAEHEFNQIIAAAPNFTGAYCSLAQMNNAIHIVHPGVLRSPDRTLRSLELARKAVQLDPIDTRAQLCLGWSHALAGQFGSADLHMDMARELNPHDPWTLIAVALFEAFRGRFESATGLARQALDRSLRPSRTHWAYEVSIAYLSGDNEGALQAADMAMDAIKTLPAWRAAALYRLGRQQEAQESAQRFLANIRNAWRGDRQPTDETIVRWLLHLYPISERAVWEALRDALRGAGLPAGTAQYGNW
jgi:DNA-binding SARP family transcriptional activator